jgi:glycosidase
METGDTTESAAPALFERMPIAWQMAERRPQVEGYYRGLAALRRGHAAFTRGGVRWLGNSDEGRVLSFERSSGGETLVVAINLSSTGFAGLVDVAGGTYRDITPGSDASAQPAAALPSVFLAPWQFRVFSRVSQ